MPDLGLIPANVYREVLSKLRAWGDSKGVPVKSKGLRNALGGDGQLECVTFRRGVYRRRKTRASQYRATYVFEFHCMSFRGDLRSDHLSDRASVLASMIEEEFQDADISVRDLAGGDPDSCVGSLQFDKGSWRNGDQRATIHGDSVDYTMETPKVEHIVVSYTATMNG